MHTQEPGTLRLMTALGAAGLISGLILASAYHATLPAIEHHRAVAMQQAIFNVLPGAVSFTAYVWIDGALQPHDTADALPPNPAVFAGYASDGQLVGYAIPAIGPGFMDDIELLYGLDVRREIIVGMEVLDHKETPGLGDKIVIDPKFRGSFQNLETNPAIRVIKRGSSSQPNEVDVISGATISTEAVINILNRSTQHWLPLLKNLQPPATE